MYGLLKLSLPTRALIIGFAVDIAIVVVGGSGPHVAEIANAALSRISDWMAVHGLQLANGKNNRGYVNQKMSLQRSGDSNVRTPD